MATVYIVLKIDGALDDAFHVVDEVLESGVLQDAINDHEYDVGELYVTSAVSHGAELFKQRKGKKA